MFRHQRLSQPRWTVILFLVLVTLCSSLQLGKLFGGRKAPITTPNTLSPITKTKQELLNVISNTGNGKDASLETQRMALQLVRFLETTAPVADDLLTNPEAAKKLDGVWYLQYTAPSDVELEEGMDDWNPPNRSEGDSNIDTRKANIQGSVRAVGITVDTSNRVTTQIINVNKQRIQNNVEQDFGTITVEGSFRVSETVAKRAIVAFDKADIVFQNGFVLSLGILFSILAVVRGSKDSGWLETTFVDEDIRIGRGNKGSLFILTRDKNAVQP